MAGRRSRRGRRDGDGYFWFFGRDDDVITSAGYRIGPGEIEECLMRHPAVAMAAAIGVPDPIRTEVVKAFIVLRPGHRLSMQRAIRVRELDGECYLSRINCEYDAPATRIFEEQRANCETVYESERDDWILAMAAAGVGFGFMPELSARHPGVVAVPLIEPEFWREVALVTVRGRQYSAAVGSLVREAMRKRWNGEPALAVAAMRAANEPEGTKPRTRARRAAST